MPQRAYLEARGFRWMETQYRLCWKLGGEAPALDPGLHVAPVQHSELAAVEAVAAHAFETSRYAMDPAIGAEWAGRRYRAWLHNALKGGVQQVLVARGQAGELLGFFVVQQTGELGYWHLTAIDPTRQGQGHGVRLWRHMMAWQIERGVRRIETAVSGHNLRVLGLYGRLGFRFSQGIVTLHRGGLLPTTATPPVGSHDA